MEEWDQWSADSRDIGPMRCIAQDAMALEEDTEFYTYARDHDLTVNEVVYYLNAYEAGSEVGLEAIRNPDIIPPDQARRSIRQISRMLEDHCQGELPYRFPEEGIAVGLYHIQQRANGDEYLFLICQLRMTVATGQWQLYWMR